METHNNNTLINMILRRELIIALLGIIATGSTIATAMLSRQNNEYEERILHLEDQVSRMEGSKEIQDAMKWEKEIRERINRPQTQWYNPEGTK